MGVYREFVRRSIVCIVAVLILAAIPVAAQLPTGTILGTVKDSSGASIAGATVTLSNVQQGFERTVSSGETGAYEFLGLAPGVYTLQVEKENFRKYELDKIELQVNTPKTQAITLDLGSSAQTVEVAASAEVLNTTDASLGTA